MPLAFTLTMPRPASRVPTSPVRRLCLLILVTSLAVSVGEVWSQDIASDGNRIDAAVGRAWPNWMGPDHDGVSKESGWSKEWPSEGLATVWTRELGIGFSSFSVADGRAYSMGHRDGKETVWCLDALSGEAIWTHSYPALLNPNLYEGGPGSTPTVHAEMVFSLSVDGRLIGFHRETGEIVWEVDLQKELDVLMPRHTFLMISCCWNADEWCRSTGRPVVSYGNPGSIRLATVPFDRFDFRTQRCSRRSTVRGCESVAHLMALKLRSLAGVLRFAPTQQHQLSSEIASLFRRGTTSAVCCSN